LHIEFEPCGEYEWTVRRGEEAAAVMTRTHLDADTTYGLRLKGPSINSNPSFHKEKEMADFRKWLMGLAIVAMFAATASAQVGPALTCTANAGVPPLLRAEGLTELVGDVVINCTGGTAGQPVTANWQIFLNTNITSRLIGGSSSNSEALLLLDEPNSASNPTPATLGANAFRATRVTDNAVTWLGVPFLAPGTQTRVVRITNVRANTSQLLPPGSTATLVPPQVVEYISVSGSQSIALNNPQQIVGFVQNGLGFDIRNCAGGDDPAPGTRFLQCVGQNPRIFADPTRGASSTNTPEGAQIAVRFRENFATAFKPRVRTDQRPSIPGIAYNTESGFLLSTASGTDSEIGAATNATRLAARFTNLPQGATVRVSLNQVTGSTTTVAVTGDPVTDGPVAAQLIVGTDVNGNGGTVASQSGTTTCDINETTIPVATLSPVGGTAMAVLEITAANPFATENLVFAVEVSFAANTLNNLPGLGTASVSGNFAPFYTSPTGTTMSSSLPVPRFVDNPINRTAFVINACVTNLLFPFVTNQAGFDTGMVISNTSLDIFSTVNQQAGACEINYFGIGSGGGATTKTRETSTSIAAGGQLLFTLSGASNNTGVTGNPGFQGYVIARCFFQYAHGFAFISDLGAARLAEGYLALVMDGAAATVPRTGSESEPLDN
jgi:hypothetical protein